MQINWSETISDIFADKVACLRCGSFHDEILVGYSRSPGSADYAPRCRDCERKEDCDSRKLVVLCEPCARELRVRGHKVDEEGMMTALMQECRRDLDESLDYLVEYWREDLDIDPDDMEKRLEEVDPEVFAEEDKWRTRLEDEYLAYHRWFREHHFPVPNPGWRSEYVEELIEAGYSTKLGD
jgi:hypothetical protein